MAKTLWEMLRAKSKGPVELQITNPLQLKIGACVNVNEIDIDEHIFYVKRIMEYKRVIDGNTYVFTDYDLLARPLGKEDVKVRIRLNPMENPDVVAGLTHNVVLLKLYEELAYDEGLHKVLTDTTKLFEVLENGVCTERYYRINDVQDSYKSQVTVVKEGDKDLEGLVKFGLEYWDYWREVKDEAGQPFNQFLFVEMDTDNGYFQMWRGEEIDAAQVSVL